MSTRNIRYSRIARLLAWLGFKPRISTGIRSGTTYGYGRLDHNGYWQYLLRIED